MTGSGHIFISYARRDGRLFAERLEQALQVAGFPVWRDSRNLDPWQDFSSELEKAIEASTKVVCCITPDVRREDSFVRRELQYSLNLKKPIVPLLFVDGGWTPIQISTVTHIDFTRQSWDTSLSNLLTRLNYADADDRTYDQVTLPEDPYREYLTALYDQIVDYLNQTVFSLITLRSASTPAAVDAPVPKRASVLPMSFFATAGIQKSETSNSAKTYPHFPAAVDAFDGQVLLLGDPGAGKTTTLFAFARDSVVKRLDDPTQPLPVLAPIATWDAVAQPPLIDWLVEQIPIFNRDELTELIHNNQILLMLDGLDELGSEREDSKSKKSFDPRLNFIKSLKTDFSTVQQMIVSCRVKDYDETGTKIALKGAVTLQPLDDHQMQDYLAEMPALWEALQSDDALREVARTPLLLSLFTFAYREASSQEVQQLRDLQSSPGDVRDKIIETFVRKSYEREARKPFADLPFSLDEVNALLGELAVRDAGKRSDFYRVPTGIVRKILKNDARIRDFVDLTTRLYLFVQHNQAFYNFIHLIVRDYYAYRSLLWQLTQPYPDEQRYEVLNTLKTLADERTVTVFIHYLQDPHPNIQLLAAAALGEIKSKAAVEPLIEGLRTARSFVRRGMVTALGMLMDYPTVDVLIAAATDDDDVWVRLFAATALRRMRYTGVFELFVAGAQYTDSDVRRYAAGELGRTWDDRAIDVLTPLLNDPEIKVRRSAERALEALKSHKKSRDARDTVVPETDDDEE